MNIFLKFSIVITIFTFQKSQAQTIDTLVNVGTHRLHFNVLKGKGIPILFEAGGGNDGTIWNSIIEPIYKTTGATIITYDRAGCGKSTIDTSDTDLKKHTIINQIEDLEAGLKKLGYDKEIMLVAHSFGGYLATLYSTRHPNLVKSVVLIDVNHKFMDKYGEDDIKQGEKFLPEFKKSRLGLYYQLSNERETTKMMSALSIPLTIPVVDFISGISPHKDSVKAEFWRVCHRNFVASHPKSMGITALECGHAIWFQNPGLVINTIAKSYAEILPDKQKIEVYGRAMTFAINSSNDVKKENKAALENNLNDLGYKLIYKNENEKALEVFKLNTVLFSQSGNAFESYGELLLKMNKKDEAIKMYKKSLDLNPENENGKKVLAELLSNNK